MDPTAAYETASRHTCTTAPPKPTTAPDVTAATPGSPRRWKNRVFIALEGLALVPRLAITTAVTVPIMTWLAMPRVTRLLRGWLYPDR
jgi:hypothetical protein